MKYLLFCIFLLNTVLFSAYISAGELVRYSLDETLEGRGLYRVQDDRASSEFAILKRDEEEWTPTFIFLDTPWYQAGSLSPAGLWRYCAMSTLLSEEELEKDTELRADRSDSSLERPAAALLYPDRGGVLFKQEDHLRQWALWGRSAPSPYLSLELGQSLVLPEEEEVDDSWFPGERPVPDDPVYITAGDLRWERTDSAFHMMSAASLSRYRKPSCSLMPLWRFYFDKGEVFSRIWYRSDSWLGSALEEPEWRWVWDNGMICHIPGQTLLSAELTGGVDSEAYFRGETKVGLQLSPGPFELKFDFDLKENRGEGGREYGYGGRIYFYHGQWRESLGGDMSFQRKDPKSWSVEAGIRRSPRTNRYDKLSCLCRAEPGTFVIKPAAESSVPLGNFRIRIALSYELLYTEELHSPDSPESFCCRITGEWSCR